MSLNEEIFNEITGKLVEKTSIEEPSSLFTERVMQSVFALEPQVVKSKKSYYSLIIIVIPVLIAGGWYLSGFPAISSKVAEILTFMGLYSNRFFSVFAATFHQLAAISMSPIVLIGSIAIFILLLIETLLTRKKYQL
jgi:hypothetical protein